MTLDSQGALYISQSLVGNIVKISPPLTPQEQTELLIEEVQMLVTAGVLNPNQQNALTTKLNSAMQQLDMGNINAATNKLQAFINQASAFINAEILSPEQAQPLIDAANDIINELNG